MKDGGEYSLKEYNTFGIAAKCKKIIKIAGVKQLQKILSNDLGPIFVLGGGSNLLISKDQNRTFLLNSIMGKSVVNEDEDFVFLRVGGGENWHDLVLWCIENNLGGLENLSLIPGTVGASPIQNIGAYGVELNQVFHELEAVNISNQEVRQFSNEDCQFAYRHSIFKTDLKDKYFITHVTYKLSKRNHKINISYAPLRQRFESKPSIKEVSDAVIEIRQSKLPDPALIGNSGSFFKNPILSKSDFDSLQSAHPDIPSYPVNEVSVKVPAGWLIDQAGWKGYRRGDAGVYEKQALVLVNHGDATGPEIWELAQDIIKDVFNKFGVELSPEVNII